MHSKSIWRALLLTGLAALASAGAVHAQPQVFGEDYAPADPVWPFPLFSTHPEAGGLYVASEFVSYRQTNTLKSQEVGFRGLTVLDNTTIIPPFRAPLPVPTFLGSHTEALDVNQVGGSTNFEPGFDVALGWKFADGSAFEFKYMYIAEVNLKASATQVPQNFQVGPLFFDSFLSANVFGFPNDYNGPAQKIASDPVGGPSSVPGIWNGAGIMTEQYLLRTQSYQATYRTPIYENETYRMSGMVGPGLVWFWERYKWVTTDIDVNGLSGPQFEAQYNNIISNRLYGVKAGCQQECYLGHGFAANLDLQGGLYADSVKTEAIYELARGAIGPGSKGAQHLWDIVPQFQATIGLTWYPIEGVELRAGYDFQVFFNTVSSPNPIDFNYGAVSPRYINGTTRLLDGLDLGLALIF